MAYTKLGRIRPVYSGEWKSDKAYTALEIVRSAGNGLAYIAQKDVPAKTPLTNSAYWAVVLDVREVLEAAENATSRINTIMDIKANALVASITGNPARLFPDENSILKPVSALEPIQSGSGDPYPAGGGKNLINSIYAGATKNGVEITRNDDGSYTLNGTCAAAGVVIISRLTLDAGTYTLSYKVFDGSVPDSEFSVAQLRHGDTEAAMNYVSTTARKTASHTLTETTNVMVRLFLAEGVTYNNWRVGIQLEKGSAATEYAPSVNFRPIIGHTKASLTRCGKNLVKYTYESSEWRGVTIIKNEDGYYTLNGTCSESGVATICYTILPPGTYTLSLEVAGGSCSTAEQSAGQLVYADENKVVASVRPNIKQVGHTLAERMNIRVRLFLNGGTTYNNWKIRVSLAASTEPAYEPYHGDDFTLDFRQTVYGCKVDWNKGELAVNWGYRVLDGTENWWHAIDSPNPYFMLAIGSCGEIVEGSDAQICSHYPWGLLESANNKANIFRIYDSIANNQARLLFRPNHDGITDVASWKAYLAAQKAAGTPVQIAYSLKNPTTIQLTPVQVLALKGLNTVYTDADGLTGTYNKDLAKAFEELRNAIIAMGGNV